MLTTTPRGRSALLSALASSALSLYLVEAVCAFGGIRLNTTSSLPLGLYLVTKDVSSNLVEFCPAVKEGALSLKREYRGKGSCPDGGEPLLKPIVARADDLVTIDEKGLSVNRVRLPNSRPLAKDAKGRLLKSWPSGTYPVKEGTVWVVSSFNLRSFDSRYFGPLTLKVVRHHLMPLLTE